MPWRARLTGSDVLPSVLRPYYVLGSGSYGPEGRPKCVFLATDSEKEFNRAKNASAHFPGIKIYAFNFDRSQYHISSARLKSLPSGSSGQQKQQWLWKHAHQLMIDQRVHVNKKRVLFQGLLDIALLAHTDVLV